MKILKYKNDNNTVEVVNKNLEQIQGNIYYYTTNNQDDIFYNYYIKCKNDYCYPLSIYDYKAPEQLTEAFKKFENYSEQEILEQIKQAKQDHKYINNLQILFVECMELFELAKELKTYKVEITKELELKREIERKLEEDKRQKEKLERNKAEEEKKQKELEIAYNKLREYKTITAYQFEILCNENNVKLPIKFVGWLREHCRTITITPLNRQKYIDKFGYCPNFLYNYETNYSYVKGHKSSSIDKYTNQLAIKVGI